MKLTFKAYDLQLKHTFTIANSSRTFKRQLSEDNWRESAGRIGNREGVFEM